MAIELDDLYDELDGAQEEQPEGNEGTEGQAGESEDPEGQEGEEGEELEGEEEDQNTLEDLDSDGEEAAQSEDGEEEEAEEDGEEEEEEDNEGDGEGEPDPSALERYLESEFNIIGGQIEFEDGETGNINDFDSEAQARIISDLVDKKTKEAVDNYLSPEEQDFIKGVREQKSVESIIEEMANKKLEEIKAIEALGPKVDYKSMDSDEVFSMYLKERNPEYSEAEIQEELDIAKTARSFDNTVDAIRQQYVADRQAKEQEFQNQQAEAKEAQYKEVVTNIVEAAREMDSVAGWTLNDDMKNDLLSDIVEKDDTGELLFDKQFKEDPKLRVKAQWFLKHGENTFAQMDASYKKLVKDSYEKGLKDGEKKKKTTPKVSATRKTGNGSEKESSAKDVKKGVKTLEDLYDN